LRSLRQRTELMSGPKMIAQTYPLKPLNRPALLGSLEFGSVGRPDETMTTAPRYGGSPPPAELHAPLCPSPKHLTPQPDRSSAAGYCTVTVPRKSSLYARAMRSHPCCSAPESACSRAWTWAAWPWSRPRGADAAGDPPDRDHLAPVRGYERLARREGLRVSGMSFGSVARIP
jgi:hypothetical protein